MDYLNLEELEAELAEVTAAISAIRKGGQSYSINTGGSIRTVTMADYEQLRRERSEIIQALREIEGSAGITLGPGW